MLNNNKDYDFTNDSFKNRMSNYFNPYGVNLDYDNSKKQDKTKSTLHDRSKKINKK